MPKELKNGKNRFLGNVQIKQSLCTEKRRAKKKLGHSESTQHWVDTKCPSSWKNKLRSLNLLTAGRGESFISSKCMLCILNILFFSSFDNGFPLGREVLISSFLGGPKSLSLVLLIASERRFCSAIFKSRLVLRAQNPHGNVLLFFMCRFRPRSDTRIAGQCSHFL